jgi:hypothetical protein
MGARGRTPESVETFWSRLAARLRNDTCNCNPVKETKMKTARKLATVLSLMTTLFTASLFADSRHRETTNDWRHDRHSSRRITVEGRISDVDRDRNGFVIRLNRDRRILFAEADTRVETISHRQQRRARVRQLESGDYIRATGTTNSRGVLYVDRITLVRDEDRRGGHDDRYLTGTVERVDRRGDVVYVAEHRSGRVIAVDTRRVDRANHRYDVDDLRRGDRITVRGDWRRDGRFEAERVELDRGW